ncbi:MAG: hypothetical protein NVV73_23055 [Cellvibrionaceae bacterium]|nr:hypothetical protein [Cellvibrionaceae bacterium]
MRHSKKASDLTVHIIRHKDDPLLKQGYEALNTYFGGRNEMEALAVIIERLKWDPSENISGCGFHYEMVVITDSEGKIACVGDYSVILSHQTILSGGAAIVHLSHIWVDPEQRGAGIVEQYMNVLTINAARQSLAEAELPADAPITLAAEMEPYEAGNMERILRLRRFFRAGLLMVDPAAITYLQPDFRAAAEIDASGGAVGVPLVLMLRRVGKEAERTMPADELHNLILGLYAMYAQTMRPQDMQVIYQTLDDNEVRDSTVALLNRV